MIVNGWAGQRPGWGPQLVRDGAPARPRVAVVAMKPQMRGRIRRNVETLLDLGADVVVITVDTGKDFLVGLEHPRLSVHFVHPVSVLESFNGAVRRANERRARRRQSRAGPQPTRGDEDRPDLVTLDPPLDPALHRRRWRLRVRRTKRFWRLYLVRARRRRVRDAVRTYGSARKQAILRLRAGLRPWHRTTRWFDFWRLSCEEVTRRRPDVIASSDLPGLVGASRAARALGVPHLHDCHELYLESTHLRAVERRLLAPVERRYMRRADAVTCVNRSIAEEYRRRYGVASVVVRNCAPRPGTMPVIDVRRLARLDPESRVVLYQGGFAPGRGLEVLVRAAEDFPADASLVLLGDGRYQADLELLADRYGVRQRVHFVDAVPPAQLLAVTASATVGVVPYQPVSLNNRLALPNKIFEYMAVGLPVVASDVPELQRLLADSGAGLVYDPWSADSLVRSLRAVLAADAYPAYREDATRYGRENSWESEQRLLIATYRSISDGRLGGTAGNVAVRGQLGAARAAPTSPSADARRESSPAARSG